MAHSRELRLRRTTGVGTEELLLYKVSTAYRPNPLAQTTGNIVFEAGVSARSWPSTQMVATPTMFIQGSTSNVGYRYCDPCHNSRCGRHRPLPDPSSYPLNVSSINDSTLTQLINQPIQSTMAGLQTAGYVSTQQLISTDNLLLGITSTGLSSISTYTGQTSNYAKGILQDFSTPLLSTTAGLGTATYISAAQLYSTVTGVIFNGSTNTLGFCAHSSRPL
jgi:hypothetical protein